MKILALLSLLIPAAPRAGDDRPDIIVAVADDWAWPHAGIYGDTLVKTPTFDRVAREGVLFSHAFCASPSCTPSRAAILTGQHIHRLEDSGDLWSTLSTKFDTYPDLLEKQGYVVGLWGKGWGPGDYKPGGRERNPAGPSFKGFPEFLKTVPKDKPFCFWFGHKDPHRPYEPGQGVKSGMKIEDVQVPPFLPDTPEVRSDLLDYYFAVQRFDHDLGRMLEALEASGRAPNTLVFVTGDNGIPFPRCKANLYDSGTRQPLAVRWPAKVKGGRVVGDLIGLYDVAPTVLEAAGVRPPASMTAQSFLNVLRGEAAIGRDRLLLERERHAQVRRGDLSYPCRALRTKEYLYIRNLRPDAWPAGDPEMQHSVGPFGDCDAGPSKEQIIARRDQDLAGFFRIAFEKRPARELYDVAKDPYNLENLAEKRPQVADRMDVELTKCCEETGDPRAVGGKLTGDDTRWDRYPYSGPRGKSK
jgi:arylsulfatase A-like enzyme